MNTISSLRHANSARLAASGLPPTAYTWRRVVRFVMYVKYQEEDHLDPGERNAAIMVAYGDDDSVNPTTATSSQRAVRVANRSRRAGLLEVRGL